MNTCLSPRETNAFAKILIIFWSTFWALSFVNSNTWHLICNNFNLNFIYDIAYLYVCVCAFSLHRESPDIILGDKPFIFEVVLLQLVPEQDWSKMHTKASKNHNNIFGEERLAHIRNIVVSLYGKLTYVLFYATTELHQQMYVVNFGVFILFCCWWPYFVVCGICKTIRTCGCLLYCFWIFFVACA
jgi:hypothetical protein